MDEKYGNYMVNFREGYVRVLTGDGDYEYIVSKEKFGSNAVEACRVFQIGFIGSKDHMRRKLGDLIGL